MFVTLIKKQLLELFQSWFINRKTGKARSAGSTALLLTLFGGLFLILGFTFYGMACGVGAFLLGSGQNWLYFAIMALFSMILGVFGSVFNTYASLYLAKDNETLLSMPIPPRTLLAARISGVYITSLMYSALMWIPAIIAYFVLVPLNVTNIVFPIILTFVIALFVTVLSCILGWVVALIASKTKGKSIITVILTLIALGIYYVVYFKIVNSLNEIIPKLGEYGTKIKSWLWYVYELGEAADGKAVPFIAVILITAALFGICFLVLSKTFTKFATASSGTKTKKVKAENGYSERTAAKALVMRELKHFTSMPTWMINGGLGLIFLPAAGIAALVKMNTIREGLAEVSANVPELFVALPVLFIAAVCFISSMTYITPVSVSLEGKTLWQLQTLPVSAWDILNSKIRMCMDLTALPVLFFAVVGGIVLQLDAWLIAVICVITLLFQFLLAEIGLWLNLLLPNLSWTNPAIVTKQSPSVAIALFGGWLFCAAVGAGGFFICAATNLYVALAAFILLYGIAALILRRWLKTKGAKILATL